MKTKYKNAPKEIAESIIASQVVDDFLPPPHALIKKESSIKVTINLSNQSITFFKQNAKRIGVSYQQMIKKLLDKYVEHYQEKANKAG